MIAKPETRKMRSLLLMVLCSFSVKTVAAQQPLSCTSAPSGDIGTFALGQGDFSLDFWVSIPPETPQSTFPVDFETVLSLTNSCADTNHQVPADGDRQSDTRT